MQNETYIFGIDTSNYKTSVAIIDKGGNIVCDIRQLLRVKQGEKGLRQSYALFQHIENLPAIIAGAMAGGRNEKIDAIAVSDRPRPVEGSYMPVFKAGVSFGSAIASSLNVPIFTFSHQEGHIEAVKQYSSFKDKDMFLCYHLSGGTSELLKVDCGAIKCMGGTKDISFGQVLDRIGVSLGMLFPCGQALDEIALQTETETKVLKEIPLDGLYVNLSGLETQAVRKLTTFEDTDINGIVKEIFNKICKCLCVLTERAIEQTGIKDVLFTGGVASSAYIRRNLLEYFGDSSAHIEFGNQELSSDNGVGIALLGGKSLWR